MFRKLVRSRFAAIVAAAVAIASLSVPALAHEGRDVGDLNFVVGFLNEPAYEGQPNAASVRITELGHESPDHGATELGHGELFTSSAVADEQSFQFTFEGSLDGQTISYHVHPAELEGTITVASGAEVSGTAEVEITAQGLSPSALIIAPGTIVEFHNATGGDMTVISGTLASMNMGGENAEAMESASLQVEIRHLATGESMTTDLEERFNDPGHYVANFIPTAPGTYEFRVFGTAHGQEVDETFTGGPTTFSDVVPAADVQFPVQLASAREVEAAARGAQDLAEQAVEDADSVGSTATLGLIFGIIGTGVGVTGVGLGLWGLQAARKRG